MLHINHSLPLVARPATRGRTPDAPRRAAHACSLLLPSCRLRISLGLKPLKAEPEAPSGPSKEELAKQEEEAKAAQAEELAERVKQ